MSSSFTSFSRYPSIGNKKSKVEGDEPGDLWVATPKYHGTNTSVWIPLDKDNEDQEIRYGRRGGFLADGEAHYGYEKILPSFDWDALRAGWAHRDDLEAVVVYGELYGGAYPHPDVPATSSARVQPGVYYSPHLRFIAFDVALKAKDGSKTFLSVYDTAWVLGRCKIPYVKIVYKGLKDDVIDWATTHAGDDPMCWLEDGHPDKNLPPLEDNIGEGFVVRPVQNRYDRFGNRCMLKVKSPRFAEIKTVKVPKKPKEYFKEKPGAITAQTYLNAARCGSVCSKFPQEEVTLKNMKALGMALVNDALKDVPSDDPAHTTGRPEAKTFRAVAFQEMAAYLRDL